MTENKDPEEIMAQSQEQTRYNSEATTATEESVDLEDAIRAAYQQLDDGEKHENLSVRDQDLKALFDGLDDAGMLEDVGERALGRLDRGGEASTKGAVLGALVRVALGEVAPDEVESAKDAKREYLASQADEF